MVETRIDEVEIVRLLENYFKQPLSIKEQESEFESALELQIENPKLKPGFYADEYSKHAHKAVIKFFKYVSRWHPANPNKRSVVAKLNDVYQELGFETNIDARSKRFVANYGDNLLRAIQENQFVALIGNRGVGKTAFINFWLNNNTKSLLEKKLQLAWFRIDAHKVYNLWQDKNPVTDKLSIVEYFKIHSAFVMLFYGGKLPLLVKDGQSLSDQFQRVFKSFDTEHLGELLTPPMSKIVQWLYDTSKNKIGDVSEILIREVAYSEPMKACFIDLYDLLQQKLFENSIGILCILDGLDNVSWSRSNEQYFKMCSQVGELREHITNSASKIANIKVKMLVVVRPETLPDIPDIDRHYHEGSQVDSMFKRYEIEPPGFQSVLNRKCSAFKLAKSFDGERKACLREVSEPSNVDSGLSFQAIVGFILGNADEFVANLKQAIVTQARIAARSRGEVTGSFQTFMYDGWRDENSNLIEVLFNKNCRAFVDGFIELLNVVEAAKELGILGATQKSRLLQYMLLNGRLYVDSKAYETRGSGQSRIRRGEYFPNLLWFDDQLSRANHSVWHGLVTIRIIQICAKRKLLGCEIVDLLGRVFGYSPRCIEDRIEALISFGLLESRLTRHDLNRISGQKVEGRWKIEMVATERGKILFDLLFAYPDWLYFMALDAPLPSLISGSSMRVRPHVNPHSGTFLNHFYDAYCITLPTIVRVIKHYDEKDRQRLEKFLSSEDEAELKTRKNLESVFVDLNTLKEVFQLPTGWSNTQTRAVVLAARARFEHSPVDYATLSRDMRGAFNAA
jgi:hypothetical protein